MTSYLPPFYLNVRRATPAEKSHDNHMTPGPINKSLYSSLALALLAVVCFAIMPVFGKKPDPKEQVCRSREVWGSLLFSHSVTHLPP